MMVARFPEPREGELAYGLYCRYGIRTGNVGAWGLFQSRPSSPDIGLMGSLSADALESLSEFGSPFQFAMQHTMLRMQVRFLPAWRKKDALRRIAEGGVIFATRHKMTRLAYCPLCALEDRNAIGEACWHAVHQTGIRACPKHHCALASVPIRAWRGYPLAPAELAIPYGLGVERADSDSCAYSDYAAALFEMPLDLEEDSLIHAVLDVAMRESGLSAKDLERMSTPIGNVSSRRFAMARSGEDFEATCKAGFLLGIPADGLARYKRDDLKMSRLMCDVKVVASSLEDGDFKDFPTSSIMDVSIKLVGGIPAAFALSRPYEIEDGMKGVSLFAATDPAYRQRGFAKELVRSVLRKSRDRPQIGEATWEVKDGDAASRATAMATGFRHWRSCGSAEIFRIDMARLRI